MARSRSISAALIRLFDASPSPIIVMNHQRKVEYCNASCSEWLKLDVDQLVGQVANYQCVVASSNEADLASALCPPPEVFAGHTGSALIQCRTVDGVETRRNASFAPLGRDDFDCVGVIVVVSCEESSIQERYAETESQALHRRLRKIRDLLDSQSRLDYFVGESTHIRRTQIQMKAAMATPSKVMVVGPDAGRCEQVARAVYYGQQRDGQVGPLVPLSCTLVDAELLQSTILDVKRRSSEWETERVSALLLLDVDMLSREAQSELLGFLSLTSFNLDVLSTSKTPLNELLTGESFALDLANLLSPVVVEFTPLSQRPEDIPILAQWFLEGVNSGRQKQLSGFSPEALDVLAAYQWPDDVEELEQVVVQACQAAEGPSVRSGDLPRYLQWGAEAAVDATEPEEAVELDAILADVEAELIRRALDRAKGNRAQAARDLGISRARLLRRIAFFGDR